MKSYLVCLFDRSINQQIIEFRKNLVVNGFPEFDPRTNIPFHITLAYFDDPHIKEKKKILEDFIKLNPPDFNNTFVTESMLVSSDNKIIAQFSSKYWRNYSNIVYNDLSG